MDMTHDKGIGLALMVPVVLLGSILAVALFAVLSPILFFVALFSPYSGIGDLIGSFIPDFDDGK